MTGAKATSRCCVCGHDLVLHIDEGTGWRCHAHGQDLYQCECWLRKRDIETKIREYDLDKRTIRHFNEISMGDG